MMHRHLPSLILLAALGLTLLSCRDAVEPLPGPDPNLLGLPSLTLLSCTPMAADSVSQVVGPAGGSVSVGPHTLTIPSGAVDSNVTVTALAPSDTVNRVRFGPAGLTFAEPALLSLSYANCATVLLPKRIVYLDESLGILALLESVDTKLTQHVTASLDHFSNYAIAW